MNKFASSKLFCKIATSFCGKVLLFFYIIAILLAAEAKAETPLQAYVYMVKQEVVYDYDLFPLELGNSIQFIWAGSNSVIDSPDASNPPTYIGGDDILQNDVLLRNCTAIGDDFLNYGCSNVGEFSGIITGPDFGDVSFGRKVYARAWNSTEITTATKYGNSELVTVAVGPSTPICLNRFTVKYDLPAPPKLGFITNGTLGSATVYNDSVGKIDFPFRVRDGDGSEDYAWYQPQSVGYSLDGGKEWISVDDSAVRFSVQQFVPSITWNGQIYDITWYSKSTLQGDYSSVLFRFKIYGNDGVSDYAVSPPFDIGEIDPWLEIVETMPTYLSSGEVARVVWHASESGDYRINLGNTNGITLRNGKYIAGDYITNIFSLATGLGMGKNPLTVYLKDTSLLDQTEVFVEEPGDDLWSFITNPLDDSIAKSFNEIIGRAYANDINIEAVSITLYDTEIEKYYNGTDFISETPIWLSTSLENINNGKEFSYNSENVPWRDGITYQAQSKAIADTGMAEKPTELVSFVIDFNAANINIIRAFPRVVGSKDAVVIWLTKTNITYALRLGNSTTGEVLAAGEAIANITNETFFTCENLVMGSNTLFLTTGESGNLNFILQRIPDLNEVVKKGKKKLISTTLDTDGDSIEFTYVGHPESKVTFNGRIAYIETIDGKGKVKIKVKKAKGNTEGNEQTDIIGIWCNNDLKMINAKGVNLGQFNLNNPYFLEPGAGGCKVIKLNGGGLGNTVYGHIEDIMDSPNAASEINFIGKLLTKSKTLKKGKGVVRADITSDINVRGELKSLVCSGGDIGSTNLENFIVAASIKSVSVKAKKYTVIEENVKNKKIAGGSLLANILVTPGGIEKIAVSGGNFANRKIQAAGNIKSLKVKSIGGKKDPTGGRMIEATICAGVDHKTDETFAAEIKSVYVSDGIQSSSNTFCVITAGVYNSEQAYEGLSTEGTIKEIKVKRGPVNAIVAAKTIPEKIKTPSTDDLKIYSNSTGE